MQSLKNIYKYKCTSQSIILYYSKNQGRENVIKFKITLTPSNYYQDIKKSKYLNPVVVELLKISRR